MSSVPFNPRRALELDRVKVKEVPAIFSMLGMIAVCIFASGVAGCVLAIYG